MRFLFYLLPLLFITIPAAIQTADTSKKNCRFTTHYNPAMIDVVFCFDTTGSMGSYLIESKNAVKRIIKTVKDLTKTSDSTVRFGFVAYRDHPPEDTTYVTKVQDLTDENTIISFINSLDADGGGDGPEAVLDGLSDAIFRISYRPHSLRFLFHIGDAPPHGNLYTPQDSSYPEGCPCGKDIDTLAEGLKARNIGYKLLKVNNEMDRMAQVFKSKIQNFAEATIHSPVNLGYTASDIIVQEIREECDITMEEL